VRLSEQSGRQRAAPGSPEQQSFHAGMGILPKCLPSLRRLV